LRKRKNINGILQPVELKKKVIQLLNNVVMEWENFEDENFRERKKVIIDFVN